MMVKHYHCENIDVTELLNGTKVLVDNNGNGDSGNGAKEAKIQEVVKTKTTAAEDKMVAEFVFR